MVFSYHNARGPNNDVIKGVYVFMELYLLIFISSTLDV